MLMRIRLDRTVAALLLMGSFACAAETVPQPAATTSVSTPAVQPAPIGGPCDHVEQLTADGQFDFTYGFGAQKHPDILISEQDHGLMGILLDARGLQFVVDRIDRTPQVLTCVATTKGFAQPVYRWRVNGVDVPNNGVINPSASVTEDEPNAPGQKTTSVKTVPIGCAVTGDAFTSTLVMNFGSMVGHIDVTIEALAAIKKEGISRIIALSLYPHYSRATTGSSINELKRVLAECCRTLPVRLRPRVSRSRC